MKDDSKEEKSGREVGNCVKVFSNKKASETAKGRAVFRVLAKNAN